MYKVYISTIVLISVLACSTNETNKNPSENDNPTEQLRIIDFSPTIAFERDEVIIITENLDSEISYNVNFNDLPSDIVEVTGDEIHAIIPENATSGEITVTYKNVEVVVGSIEISETNEKLHVVTVEDNSYLIKIEEVDLATGEALNQIYETNIYYNSYLYFQSPNITTNLMTVNYDHYNGPQGTDPQKFAYIHNFDTNTNYHFDLIDDSPPGDLIYLSRQLTTTTEEKQFYTEYTYNIFAEERLTLKQIDLNTFEHTEIFQFPTTYDWPLNDNSSGYNPETNTLFAFTKDENGISIFLKIDLNSNTISTEEVVDSSVINYILRTSENHFYAIDRENILNRIVEIDPETGGVIDILTTIESDDINGIYSLKYSESTNRFYTIAQSYNNISGLSFFIVSFDTSSGNQRLLNLNNENRTISLVLKSN